MVRKKIPGFVSFVVGFTCIFVLLVISGCSMIARIVQKPAVEFESVSRRKISLLEETLLFKMRITNPNPIGIRVNYIEYHLQINEVSLVNSRVDEPVSVGARGTAIIELPIRISHLEMLRTIGEFIKAREAKYELSGTVGFGFFEIPFRNDGQISIIK